MVGDQPALVLRTRVLLPEDSHQTSLETVDRRQQSIAVRVERGYRGEGGSGHASQW